jgi:hypothetical protein
MAEMLISSLVMSLYCALRTVLHRHDTLLMTDDGNLLKQPHSPKQHPPHPQPLRTHCHGQPDHEDYQNHELLNPKESALPFPSLLDNSSKLPKAESLKKSHQDIRTDVQMRKQMLGDPSQDGMFLCLKVAVAFLIEMVGS